MTEVAGERSNPRPPRAEASASRGGGRKDGPTSTAELLRRRLAQAEAHLREMEDEARRVSTQQSHELEILEKERDTSLGKLEMLRMEECMTPAELDAIRADTAASTAARRQQTAATLDSKLLASTSVKYREARDLVQRKRAECAEVEARLAATRSKLASYRSKRNHMRRSAKGPAYAATVRRSRVGQMQSQSREQLRGLEGHVATEQERLSSMISDAKTMRAEIDALLIAQSHFEKTYRRREDDLLDKKRQMSYIMEVCTLFFEERAQKHREIEELRALSEQENKTYDTALDELDGVLAENRRGQSDLEQKLRETRKELRETQKRRVALIKTNHASERELESAKERLRRQQQSLVDASPHSSGSDAAGGARPQLGQQARRLNDVDGAAEASVASATDDGEGTAQHQIQQFDLVYERLAELAGSDRLDDVLTYIDMSAEERFSFFSELNYLHDEMAKLTSEKARLLGEDADGADAEREGILANEKKESLGADRSNGDADAEKRAATRVQRAGEMEQLQATLDRLTLQNADQGEEGEALDQTYEELLTHVRQMFAALGCDAAVIRGQSGAESVLRTNVADCLALVDQRVEEYLLALARTEQEMQQQLLLLHEDGDAAQQQLVRAQHQQPKQSVARTFLRRPDLPPRVASEEEAGTPSADAAAATSRRYGSRRSSMQASSLSAKQLVQRSKGGLPRSVEPRLGTGAATSAGNSKNGNAGLGAVSTAGGHGTTVRSLAAALDADVPLSLEEMQRLVRERHGDIGTGAAPSETVHRRFP